MAFSDLTMKVTAEAALQAIYPELVRLQDFAHTYSELDPSFIIHGAHRAVSAGIQSSS